MDYDHIRPVKFDLALRKYIKNINGKVPNESRVPVVHEGQIGPDYRENDKYIHPKEPLTVKQGDLVEYGIRVYNEGNILGKATEFKDSIPKHLEFVPDNEINKKYLWKMLDVNGNETEETEKAVEVRTRYLEDKGDIPLKGQTEEKNGHYKEVFVVFKVKEDAPNTNFDLKNIAEISEDDNEYKAKDIDSTPDNNITKEDDIDYEELKIEYIPISPPPSTPTPPPTPAPKPKVFDLALKKIISGYEAKIGDKVEKKETNHTFEMNPEPIVKIDIQKNKTDKVSIKYVYKIQIKNEGEIPGSATEIKDYIPDGLIFRKEDNPNWNEISPGVVVTTQLKDKILKPGETAVVEIILRWDENKAKFTKMTNMAEISKDWNEDNIPDIDSTPDNRRPGEDDIDDASVALTIETGANQTFFTITFSILTFAGISINGIKKYVI